MNDHIINFSPNFSNRKDKVKYIIIHYTGMKNLKDTLQLFKTPASKVSCHWLISKKGILYKIVEENKVAWHAGYSQWKKDINLNNISIGIELQNRGHGKSYSNFTNSQFLTLEKLIQNIFVRFKIKKENVLGHSDIAPERKLDPGELFNWNRLAKKNLAFWPKMSKSKKKNILLQLGDKGITIRLIKKKLIKIGYKCSENDKFDIPFKLTIEAFQRRFYQDKINGIIDDDIYHRILSVAKKA